MKRGVEDGPAEEGLAKRTAAEGLEGDPAARAPHDQGDDDLDDLGIPEGWRECPAMGRLVDRLIPMKVPLGARFDSHIAPEHRFNISDAVAMARHAVEGVRFEGVVPHESEEPGQPPVPRRVELAAEVALVIDLTNSSRYYDAQQWMKHGLQYIKIPCRGRGQPPQPEAVNDLCWEVQTYMRRLPQGVALIHCTHGFNRTGYMVAAWLARSRGWVVPKCLDAFRRAREPGIYKHYYIRDLFRYYHERLPGNFPFPAQPAWKGGGSPEQEDELEEEDPHAELHHDDPMGEAVDVLEAQAVQQVIMDLILGHDPDRSRVWLPGSQPVSLDSTNLQLLRELKYWVTWKADGTRYMLLLCRNGTYLVDRKFAVTRVQMRWPTPRASGQQLKGPVGPAHHLTVLDGEMVVDEVLQEDRWERRFLAYDMPALNGVPLVDKTFAERYKMIQKWVIEPRKAEETAIQKGHWTYQYQYHKEAFRVRRKGFWPLTKTGSLLHNFSKQLTHESDGLIFQPAMEPYVPGTCPELLKWKYAELNSVDFRLRNHPQHGLQLELLETRRGGLPKGRHRGYNALPGARVEFPEGIDPSTYDMRIIECSYDSQRQVWRFMRERQDKDTANAYHVYESVARSIEDNIQGEELLQYVDEALRLPLYDEETGREAQQQAGQQQQQAGQPQQQAGAG